MKLVLRHVNHHPSRSLTELLDKELDALRGELRIDEARVCFERLEDASPPFRVAMHLVTPGPDVVVEATDHTLRVALLKAVEEIRSKLVHRRRKRAGRRATAPAIALTRRHAAGPSRG